MENRGGSPAPEKFRSIAGGVFPLYHVLADIGEFAGGEITPVSASHPLRVDGLSIQKDGRSRTLAANLTPSTQTVTIQKLPARVRVSLLDEESVEEAMAAPEEFRRRAGEERQTSGGALALTLRPYAVARIDAV
jgi:hypothetical protein